MRTYIYVDGENFAIRAAALAAELAANPAQAMRLMSSTNISDMGSIVAHQSVSIWSPQPHRTVVMDERLRGGILFTKDELYWDSVGLYIALRNALPNDGAQNQPVAERASYFTSAIGGRIDQHRADLHSIGFTPFVSVRVKPDSWTKQLAAQGITVVSRPKPIDLLIATQVLEDCYSNNFDRCIFVGGDEDYAPLLEAVRRRGKQVWLVAFERWLAQGQLRYMCDRFIAYDPVLCARPISA